MYGLVNRAVHEMVVSQFGKEAWQSIAKKAQLDVSEFVSMQAYDDDVTYRMVAAASEVLNLEPDQVLEAFGEYWTVFTAAEGYGNMMTLAGDSLVEFLQNLDELHARVGLNFPELRPPSFECHDIQANSLRVRYFSERPGLTALVVGLIRGLGRRFDTAVEVDILSRASDGNPCDEFEIRFSAALHTQ